MDISILICAVIAVAGVIVNRTQQEIPNAETMKQTESHAVKIVVEAARRLI